MSQHDSFGYIQFVHNQMLFSTFFGCQHRYASRKSFEQYDLQRFHFYALSFQIMFQLATLLRFYGVAEQTDARINIIHSIFGHILDASFSTIFLLKRKKYHNKNVLAFCAF